MNWSFADLEGFLTVAETKSFRASAERLNLTASALSKRIQKIEKELGNELFQRTTRQVRLTSAGQEFLPIARKLLADLDSYLMQAHGTASHYDRRLAVGCIPSMAATFLAPILVPFHRANPTTRLRVFDGSYGEVVERVRSGDAEFAINFTLGTENEVDFLPLFKDPFVIGCAKSHPLAKKRSVTWADITRYPCVTISRHSGNRLLLDVAASDSEYRITGFYEVDNLSSALEFVEAGLGISVLPRYSFTRSYLKGLAIKPISGLKVHRQIGIMQRPGAPLSRHAEQLKAMILEAAAKLP